MNENKEKKQILIRHSKILNGIKRTTTAATNDPCN